MKHLSLVLGLSALLFMAGCSDKSSSKRVTTRGNRGTPVAPSTPGGQVNPQSVIDILPQGQMLSGEIFETVDKLSLFQQHADNLISSFMEPAYLEYDEDEFGLLGARTGISFGGQVEFSSINYEPGMALDSSVKINVEDSKLRVSIFDELVGEEYVDENGDLQIYTEIPMDFGLDSLVGYRIIDGNRMSFLFRDVFGEVYFTSEQIGGMSNENGQIYFSGSFHYRNFTDYRGNDLEGKWNSMGYFTIPACGFFKCR